MIMVAVVGIVITIVENVLMLPAYGNPSLADTLVISTFHRSVFLVIEIVVNTVLLAVILIGAKRKIKLRKPSDFVIAIVISLLLLILVDASVWLEMQVGDDLTALGYIAAIAFSRLYNYVHFPTDVLCGILLGVIVAIIVTFAFKKTKVYRKLLP